ncbi:DUF6011 domain-containing protein [Streptomyces sp. NPDC050703]|uniref:DUF6011 domain-containing protein n=1 Tax=Streptomyces sp. NPDC050703 TaxID=3157218 RepID=UPI00343F2347
MDDASPHQQRTPRDAPAGAVEGGEQSRGARMRSAASLAAHRVRERAVKAALAARPHVMPVVTAVVPIVTTVAVTSLLASARDDDRPADLGMSPSPPPPSCTPADGGPSTTCRECGRPLTDELSRQAGYGPTCARLLLL